MHTLYLVSGHVSTHGQKAYDKDAMTGKEVTAFSYPELNFRFFLSLALALEYIMLLFACY